LKIVKRILFFIFTLIMLLCFVSCGGSNKCKVCNGSGYYQKKTCVFCSGSGKSDYDPYEHYRNIGV